MRLAKLVSAVIHPPSVTALAIAVISSEYRLDAAAVAEALAFIAALPVAPVVASAASGRTDLNVSRREERPWYLAAALASYLVALALLDEVQPLARLARAYFMVTLGVLAASLRVKVSIHVAGLVGPTIALAIEAGAAHLLLLLLLPVVWWARLKLRAHSSRELALGAAIAALLTALSYML
ncbi:MAG: hypothetical protein DRN96_03930 [Thermoproteota archaeon]|nr:MAG: hypothetical protein DRN96_03930 [Candidatus Korarchaeota archaeon]